MERVSAGYLQSAWKGLPIYRSELMGDACCGSREKAVTSYVDKSTHVGSRERTNLGEAHQGWLLSRCQNELLIVESAEAG